MFKSAAENYEIIRFMEHGNRWHPAMDCVQGELLIDRVRRCPEVEKEEVFGWIRQLAQQLERFHRCRSGQCYRYVNPYSVMITRDGQIMLLDLDAQSNAFVLKNMQKRAMRNHFVKPLLHIRDHTRLFADFYGFGKTVQFLMASTIPDPPLTRGESRKLYRITEKCLSEDPKRVYQEFGQIQRDLPVVRNPGDRRKIRGIAVSACVLFLAAGSVMYRTLAEREERGERMQSRMELVNAEDGSSQSVNSAETDNVGKAGVENADMEKNTAEQSAESTVGEHAGDAVQNSAGLDRQVAAALGEQLAFQTSEGNREVIRCGENIKREVLRCLGEAYIREKQTEQALDVYRELCRTETDTERLREIYMKRIQLEEECGDSQAALETGREASARFSESKEIQTAYLKTIYQCETVKKEERQQEAKNLVQRYPFLKETESYIQLKETFHLLGNTEESAGKEAQENTEQGKEVQENTEQENIAQENPAPESASQEETTPAENGSVKTEDPAA